MLYVESSTLNLTKSTFQNNSAANGGVIFVDRSSTLDLSTSTFQNNSAEYNGGVLYVGSSTLNLSTSTFQNNSAEDNGGVLYVESSTLNLTKSTFQNNSAIDGGAIFVDRSSTLNLSTSTFQNNSAVEGGAIFVDRSSTLNLSTSTFQNNSAASWGGVLCAWSSNLSITKSIFQNNSAEDDGGVIFVGSSTLNLSTSTFQSNSATHQGGVLAALWSSNLIVTSMFQNNLADGSGGVLHVAESSTLNLITSTFQNNSAEDDGGALYVDSSTLNLTRCIFQSNSANVKGGALCVGSSTLILTNSIFQNNTSDLCGGALYGLSSTFIQFTRNTFQNNFATYGEALDIFSDQLHLCICRNNVIDCNGSYHHPEPVYPGGTLQVPVIAYGQWNETTAAIIPVSNTPNGDITIENSQNVINYNTCSLLKYIIHSHAIGTTQELTLYIAIAKSPCSPTHTSTKMLTVTVGILPCPTGFQLTETQSNCICAERLQQFTNTCLVDYTTVLRVQDAEFWVGYDKKSRGLILHPHCPLDYCTLKETYLAVDDSDKQCNYNRSGLLCGRCSGNLSLALGSSRCLQCSNTYLLLLAGFGFAGIALVILLLVLRLTVAAGTINGLIFYANVIAVNSAIFFQTQTTNAPKILVHTAKVFTVFIAWLNLDLGIETCFYNGTDTYIKTWLQFSFPLYVWALVGMIIIGSHYSGRISRLFGSNPIAILATLFLLSYAKLLRIVIVTLSYTYLQYPNNSQTAVWLYDGNIRYLSGKHIALFTAAMVCLIFLFLPYTMLLIFSQWLQAKSELKIFSCISSPKVKPFLDAYHAPYTDKHRYWTGLMLLLRFILFLIFAVNSLGDPSVNLLAIASTTVTILTLLAIYKTRIYKMHILSLLEISFILNLTILAVATLYIHFTGGNQNAATLTSVGIAFATFTGTVIYHSIQQIKGTRLWRRLRIRHGYMRIPMTDDIASGSEDPPDSPLNLVFMSGSAPTQTVVDIRDSELREPCMATD